MNSIPSKIRLEIDVENLTSVQDVTIEMSSNYLSISAPDFHKFETLLPYTVLRSRDTCAKLDRNRQILMIDVLIDPSDSSMSSLNDTSPDAGSRPWLLARALREGAPEEQNDNARSSIKVTNQNNSEEFPEDRFLKQDALSQHYIQQKEEARKNKLKRAAEERKKREKNPNVEYIDDLTEWAKKRDEKKNEKSTIRVEEKKKTEENVVAVDEKKEEDIVRRTIPKVPGLKLPTTVSSSSSTVSSSKEKKNGDDSAAATLKASHDLIFDLLE